MHDAGFFQPVVDSERLTLIYPDLFALMRDLRRSGMTKRCMPVRAALRRVRFSQNRRALRALFPAPRRHRRHDGSDFSTRMRSGVRDRKTDNRGKGYFYHLLSDICLLTSEHQ
jgi:hypothetical protein